MEERLRVLAAGARYREEVGRGALADWLPGYGSGALAPIEAAGYVVGSEFPSGPGAYPVVGRLVSLPAHVASSRMVGSAWGALGTM